MNATDESPPLPPPPPPPLPPTYRRLTRSSEDKVLTGLCGGLGRHFGIDPVVFRIAFVVFSLAGGAGVLLYLVGWLFVPDDTGVTEMDALVKQRRIGVLAILAVVGCLLLFKLGSDGWGGMPVAVTLIAVGAAVLVSRRQRPGGGHPASPAPPAPPGGPEPRVDTGTVPATFAPPLPPPPPPAPARPRSVLVPVTLCLLAVLAGLLGLAGVPLAVSLGLLLLVTGVALVVGAWRGRALWLIPVAVVLVAGLGTASVADVRISGGIGDRSYTPQTVGELRPTYRLGIGNLVLDLSRLDLTGRSVDVLVTTGIGEVDVIVPARSNFRVEGHAGMGEVRLFGTASGGTDVDREFAVRGLGESNVLNLRARVGIGQVEVSRAAA